MLYYHRFAFNLFLFFLAGTLTFGRYFSLVNIPTAWLPVYITEITLILLAPYICMNLHVVRQWPRAFKISAVAFLLLSTIQWNIALLPNNNLLAIRDIIFNVYMAFILLGYLFVLRLFRSSLLMGFMVIVNLAALLLARDFFVAGGIYSYAQDCAWIGMLLSNVKATHIGFSCGMFLAFYMAYFFYTEGKLKRAGIYSLMLLNVYTICIAGERSLWVALFFLFVTGFVFGEGRFFKQKIGVILSLVVLSACVTAWDKKLHRSERMRIINYKMSHVLEGGKEIVLKLNANLAESRQLKTNSVVEHDPATPLMLDADLTPAEKKLLGIKNEVAGSYQWRWDIIKQSFFFGMEAPVFGQGFGKYPNYMIYKTTVNFNGRNPAADSGIVPAHNHIVTVFFKLGIVGLLLFLAMNGAAFYYNVKALAKSGSFRWITEGLLGTFVFWHVLALLFDVIDSPTTNVFLWIIMGAILKVYYETTIQGEVRKNA